MAKKKIRNMSRIMIFLILFLISEDLQSNLEQYFPALKIILESPAFQSNSLRLTKTEDIFQHLKKLESSSKHVTYKEMELKGASGAIPYIIISENRNYSKEKLTVWIQAMQHGDESGSGEAALALSSFFSKGVGGYLEKMNIIIVPRLNIEGAEKEKAALEGNIDLNTDHMTLFTQEAKALKKEINKYEPEIIIDLHEYPTDEKEFRKLPGNKIFPYYDVLIATPNNRNIPKSIEQTEKEIIEKVKTQLEDKGIRINFYYNGLRKEEEKITLTLPSSSAKIARNTFALIPTLSILMEGRGKGTGLNLFQRRVGSLTETTVQFFNIFKLKGEKIKEFINDTRKDVAENKNGEIILITGGETYQDSYEFIDLEEEKVKKYSVTVKADFKDTGGLRREKPTGYLLSSKETGAIKNLEDHGIKYSILDRNSTILVEEYIVSQDRKSYSLERKEIEVEAGNILVELNQNQNTLIILLFEPESETSFINSNIISRKKQELPFKRVIGMSKIKL